METALKEYADTVKLKEYKDLFPETPVEEAKEDPEKVKEALFQVHHMVYNKQLYNKITGQDDYYISLNKIEDLTTEQGYERIKKQLQGVTMTEEDGETLVPKRDVKQILTMRNAVLD